jgi:hypothetical protein
MAQSCLRRANDLVDITSRQNSTNPSYRDLLDIMSLRSGLQEESICVDKELNYFLNYDEKFVTQQGFYVEISKLGRTSRETVDKALVVSTRFLRSLTDIDDVFQDSKVVCLRLAVDIMSFVDKGNGVNPEEAGDLEELRGCLKRKFARLKGSWENLVQSTLDYNETVVFAELAELVEVTEAATDDALFGSEDLLQQLMDRDLCDGIAYYGVDDTSDSEDDGVDSTLRHGADDVEGSSMTEDDFLWTDCDTADDQDEPEENKDSPTAVTNVVAEEVEAKTLSGHYVCIGARGKVIDNSVSDVRRETDSSGAGHRGR